MDMGIGIAWSRIVPLCFSRLKDNPRLCTRVWSNKPNDTIGNESFLDLSPDRHLNHTLRSEDGLLARHVFSPCETPAVLLACKESFQLCSNNHTQTSGNCLMSNMWLDFKKNTIYLESHNSNWWMYLPTLLSSVRDFTSVQNLAICWLRSVENNNEFEDRLNLSPADSYCILEIVAEFVALKKLTFVTAYHDYTDPALSNLVWMDMFDMPSSIDYYKQPYDPNRKQDFEISHYTPANNTAVPVLFGLNSRSHALFGTHSEFLELCRD